MPLADQGHTHSDLAPTLFIKETFALYREHQALFLRILLPAIVLGYVSVMAGNHKSEEMLSQLPQGREALSNLGTIMASSGARLLGFAMSWILYCFAYAATCVAMSNIEKGTAIGAEDAYSFVRERLARFFPVSILLFVILVIGVVLAAFIMGFAVPYFMRWAGIPAFGIFAFASMMIALGAVTFGVGRLALSLPAVIVGEYRIGESFFLSDELTEGRYLVVGALLLEGVVGTSLAALTPYWIAGQLFGDALWPMWLEWGLHAAAILAAAILQPVMFVGFALLYLRAERLKASEAPPVTLTTSHS